MKLLAIAVVPVAALTLVVTSGSAPQPGPGPDVAPRGGSGPTAVGSGRAAVLGSGPARLGPAPAALGSAGAAEVSRRPGSPLAARWHWPLSPRPAVVRPFLRPATRYGPGHRGIDLAASAGQVVTAVADGTVTHVGVIAGRGTVTVTHATGIRSTYEPVTAAVEVGDALHGGAAVGRLEPDGSHCAPGPCLHLGALRGREYLDPLLFLGAARVRLLPLGPW